MPYGQPNYWNANGWQSSWPNRGWPQAGMNGYSATQSQPPIDGLTRVTGLEGAKAYSMPPNSCIPLFDGSEDIFYVKSTDAAGFPTIRSFKFEPIQEAKDIQPADTSNYVTAGQLKAAMDEIKAIMSSELEKNRKSIEELVM